jgi:hypothetical protein
MYDSAPPHSAPPELRSSFGNVGSINIGSLRDRRWRSKINLAPTQASVVAGFSSPQTRAWKLLRCLLIKILLKAREDPPDLVRPAEVGHGIRD